jgi:hypothetical protein
MLIMCECVASGCSSPFQHYDSSLASFTIQTNIYNTTNNNHNSNSNKIADRSFSPQQVPHGVYINSNQHQNQYYDHHSNVRECEPGRAKSIAQSLGFELDEYEIIEKGVYYVKYVDPSSASALAGLKQNDKITKINGKSTNGMSYDQFCQEIAIAQEQQQRNNMIHLMVLRRSAKTTTPTTTTTTATIKTEKNIPINNNLYSSSSSSDQQHHQHYSNPSASTYSTATALTASQTSNFGNDNNKINKSLNDHHTMTITNNNTNNNNNNKSGFFDEGYAAESHASATSSSSTNNAMLNDFNSTSSMQPYQMISIVHCNTSDNTQTITTDPNNNHNYNNNNITGAGKNRFIETFFCFVYFNTLQTPLDSVYIVN